MSSNLDSILEQCLSQISAGRATVWNCLARYPDLSGELEPMLLAAEEISALPKPALSAEARSRIEGRLFDAFENRSRARSAAEQRPRSRAVWRLVPLGFGVAIIAILLLAVLVNTVGETLPGSPLHPIKLAAENTWLWLSPDRQEPRLHLTFARRRLDEVEALTAKGSVDLGLVNAMAQETQAALDAVEELPPAVAVPLMDDLVALIADQKQTLSTLVESGPAVSQEEVTAALQINAEQQNRAQVLVSSLPMPPAIDVFETANPSSVLEPGGLVEFTVRVTNGGVEDVKLVSLEDDVLGNLQRRGSCSLAAEGIGLGSGESYECAFEREVAGNAGDSETSTVTAVAVDDEGYRARVSASAAVNISDALPVIAVLKTSSVDTLPEPGDMVRFAVRIANRSFEVVELISLVDDVHGDLNGRGTCAVAAGGITLDPGEYYACTFNADVFGNAGDRKTNTVTAVAADDEDNRTKAAGSATIVITDVLPKIRVSKMASPGRVGEPGGTVQFRVRVINDGVEGVTLTSLADDKYGNLNGQGTCSVPLAGVTISLGGRYECVFSAEVTGNAGDTVVDTVTALASDDEGNAVSATGSASVRISDVLPILAMHNSAKPGRVPEPGGMAEFTVHVTNGSVEDILLTSLVDDVHGNLSGKGTCSVPRPGLTIRRGGSYKCAFQAEVSGNAGDLKVNTVTAVAADDEGNRVKASDRTAVAITDVLPQLEVSKVAYPSRLREPGGVVQFTVRVTNQSVEDVVLTSLVDSVHGSLSGQGTCSVPQAGLTLRPNGLYKCTFSAELSGNAGDSETDSVTAVVVDDEGNRAKASGRATVNIIDVLPVIAVSKTVQPTSVPEPGSMVEFTLGVTNQGVEDVTLTSLVDDVYGNLNGKGTCAVPRAGMPLAPGQTYRCAFSAGIEGNGGQVKIDTVTAEATDDERNKVKASDRASVTIADVLPAIAVVETVNRRSLPEPGGTVEFTVQVTNRSVEEVKVTSLVADILGDLNGQGSCSVPRTGIGLNAGESYACTFRAEVSGNAGDTTADTVTAQASDDEGNRVKASGSAAVSFTDVPPTIAVSKSVKPSSVPEPGAMVEFTVRVANQSVEPVRLTSLVDNVHGDLHAQGTCPVPATGVSLNPNESYECTFGAMVSGNAGETQTDTVTAQASDDEGNQVKASASAAVSIVDVPPAISVSTSADPSSLLEPGGMVQFTVRVMNEGGERITLTSLVDEIYGNLNGWGNCSLPPEGIALGALEAYGCAFTAEVLGNAGYSQTGAVMATVTDDEGNRVEGSSLTTVSITDRLPTIAASKTASPGSLPEPGGMVQFAVRIKNQGVEDAVLTSLVDDIHGDLNGQGTCFVPATGILLSPGGSYECAFSTQVLGNAGDVEIDTITAHASDDEGNQVKASASATVSITDVPPAIGVTKLADPATLPEPGGMVQFTVRVTNYSVENVTLSALRDDTYGDLNGQGTCAILGGGIGLLPGGWYECSFAVYVSGTAGDLRTGLVRAFVSDDEGNGAEAIGGVTVTITAQPSASAGTALGHARL